MLVILVYEALHRPLSLRTPILHNYSLVYFWCVSNLPACGEESSSLKLSLDGWSSIGSGGFTVPQGYAVALTELMNTPPPTSRCGLTQEILLEPQ